jgi:hypothetical protein
MSDTIDLGVESPVEAVTDSSPTAASFSSLLDAYDAVLMESDDSTDQQVDDTGANDAIVDGAEPDDGDFTTESFDGWDWKEFSNKPVAVKVNGQETEVPLEELRNGYMRQQDYTLKTQELAESRKLAEWAKEFQTRFSEDPQQMVRMLASAVGADLGQGNVEVESDPFAELLASDPELAPVANTIKRQNQIIETLYSELSELKNEFGRTRDESESERNLRLVKEEISQMKTEFQDFDEMQVLPIAARTGLDLKASYLLLKGAEWQKSQTNPSASQTLDTAPPAAKRVVDPNKKKAAQAVTNSRFAGTPSTDGDQYSTFSELFDIVARTEGAA